MTADREELYRKLHDEAETSIERPQYRVLAHTLLNMFETLLDPKQAAIDFHDEVAPEDEIPSAESMIYGEYENLLEELHRTFD
jgi:hypothetical protein